MTALALLAAVSMAGPTLYRIEVKGRFGFVNRQGNAVVPPALKAAGRMREGLAWFSRDGKRFGYLDAAGKVAIPPRFAFAADFSEGLAAAGERPVRDGWATYGFIDKGGRFRIPERYKASEPDPGDGPIPLGYAAEIPEGSGGIEAARFERGRAEVSFKRWIGKDGRKAPPPPVVADGMGPLREGLRSFRYDASFDGSCQLWYVRGSDGKTPPRLTFKVPRECEQKPDERSNYFSEGLAPAWRLPRGAPAVFGYVDKEGRTPFGCRFDEIRPFHGGLAEVVRLGRTQYIDRAGKRVWPK